MSREGPTSPSNLSSVVKLGFLCPSSSVDSSNESSENSLSTSALHSSLKFWLYAISACKASTWTFCKMLISMIGSASGFFISTFTYISFDSSFGYSNGTARSSCSNSSIASSGSSSSSASFKDAERQYLSTLGSESKLILRSRAYGSLEGSFSIF